MQPVEVRADALPTIVDSIGVVGMSDSALLGGAIPIAAMIGGQQGATIGQGCLTPGAAKATFGTGAFILPMPVSGRLARHMASWRPC